MNYQKEIFTTIREVLIINTKAISIDGKLKGAFIEKEDMEKLLLLMDELEKTRDFRLVNYNYNE